MSRSLVILKNSESYKYINALACNSCRQLEHISRWMWLLWGKEMISISRYLNMNGKNCLKTILHRGNATYPRSSQGERMDLFWIFCVFYIWERICGLTEWRCNISLHHFRLLMKIISTALARYKRAQPTVGDLEWAMGELRYGKYDVVLLENCETRTNGIPF